MKVSALFLVAAILASACATPARHHHGKHQKRNMNADISGSFNISYTATLQGVITILQNNGFSIDNILNISQNGQVLGNVRTIMDIISRAAAQLNVQSGCITKGDVQVPIKSLAGLLNIPGIVNAVVDALNGVVNAVTDLLKSLGVVVKNLLGNLGGVGGILGGGTGSLPISIPSLPNLGGVTQNLPISVPALPNVGGILGGLNLSGLTGQQQQGLLTGLVNLVLSLVQGILGGILSKLGLGGVLGNVGSTLTGLTGTVDSLLGGNILGSVTGSLGGGGVGGVTGNLDVIKQLLGSVGGIVNGATNAAGSVTGNVGGAGGFAAGIDANAIINAIMSKQFNFGANAAGQG